MKKTSNNVFSLVIFILVGLIILCVIIPLFHNLLFNSFAISNYEEKEGIISDIIITDYNRSGICENIVVDNYKIFVKCGDDYKQQYKIGDKTNYYVYNNHGYHNIDQMKSGSIIGKILDFGMIGTYILIFIWLKFNAKKYVDKLTSNS